VGLARNAEGDQEPAEEEDDQEVPEGEPTEVDGNEYPDESVT
jgi:hypothetical protein